MFWLFPFSAPRTRELHRAHFSGSASPLCQMKLQVICWGFGCFLSLTASLQSAKLPQPCHFWHGNIALVVDHMMNAFLLDPFYHKDILVTMRILSCVLPQHEASTLLVRKRAHHVLEEASNSSTDIGVIFSDWWLRVYPSAAVYKPSGLIMWAFPVPKVVLSRLVLLASGSTRSVKTRFLASREWRCPSVFFLLGAWSLRIGHIGKTFIYSCHQLSFCFLKSIAAKAWKFCRLS